MLGAATRQDLPLCRTGVPYLAGKHCDRREHNNRPFYLDAISALAGTSTSNSLCMRCDERSRSQGCCCQKHNVHIHIYKHIYIYYYCSFNFRIVFPFLRVSHFSSNSEETLVNYSRETLPFLQTPKMRQTSLLICCLFAGLFYF